MPYHAALAPSSCDKNVNLRTVVERVRRILERALPGHEPASCELLTGGATNLNYRLRFEGLQDLLVLRIHTRDPGACAKELAILRSAEGFLPVPEVIYASPSGDEDLPPHILYRFVEGITFQELKSRGDPKEIAEAAYAIGSALAHVPAVRPPRELGPRAAVTDESLDSPLLEQRLGCRELDGLREVLSGWWPRIGALLEDRCLVHGDYNNRNAILAHRNGRWEVAAILDWELAFVGSPLWDAARFICYEQPFRPRREPHFSRGFIESGGQLPEDWTTFARVLNAATAAESVSRPDLPERFIPELRELIIRTSLRP
jgi:aminoglycoside phosphotransferase (APT) family kinase protein